MGWIREDGDGDGNQVRWIDRSGGEGRIGAGKCLVRKK